MVSFLYIAQTPKYEIHFNICLSPGNTKDIVVNMPYIYNLNTLTVLE